ncbi:hypothetical protein SLS56_008911 [Neofusicoccum ribis]|uniref:Uncharacterized protein n=1 Tax=Neofusicoccum ribis TaxID=45134 RepID=A0ABR3SIS5_9PEZI
MQAVGGSYGALSYTANGIDIDINWANDQLDFADYDNQTTYPNLRALYQRDTRMQIAYAGINQWDQIRENDTVPLQFNTPSPVSSD